MPARHEMPTTFQRSPREAQENWSKAHDSERRDGHRGRDRTYGGVDVAGRRKQELIEVAGAWRA